jgi:hypothetical protein
LPASVTSGTNIIVAGTNEFFIVPDVSSFYLGSLVDLAAASFSFTTATSFRFYGWNSEASGGTFSIDDVVIDGSVTGGTLPCAPASISAITANAPICAGQTLNLGSTVLGDAPFTYTWTGAGTIVSPNVSSTAINGATSSDYTLTVANSCGTATSVVTTTVNTLPVVTLSTASINLQCVTINSVTLDGGSPLNGIYSGNGVTAGVFSPATVGVGTYTITYTFTDANNCSNSASDNITVDACTGIQVLKTESFTIYPNPSNGVVVINAPIFPAKVNLFDVNGKLVISQNITAMESLLDLSKVVNGIYQLTITTEQKSFNYKIMINK